MTSPMPHAAMWSDNETELDLVGFEHLVGAATSIVRNPALLPATVGIFGDWGGGKSSLLQMICKELRKSDDVVVVSVNGWLFEGYDDAKLALMGSILDDLAASETVLNKAKDKLARLFQRVRWLRVGGTLLRAGAGAYVAAHYGVGAGAAATAAPDLATAAAEAVVGQGTKAVEELKDPKKLKEFLKDDPEHAVRQSVRGFRKDFEDLLDKTGCSALVVVIDDLDRCTPDTIIATLEAIKLFLFVPRTAFLIGADERLVQYAVRRRFPELPGERVDVGRDYLEKLIQYPIRVPALGQAETETYINLLFAHAALTAEKFEEVRVNSVTRDSSLLTPRLHMSSVEKLLDGKVPQHLLDSLDLAQTIAPLLASGTRGNPRQCKRFLNTLTLRVQMANTRKVVLKSGVLAKLMLLEYFHPITFEQLAQLQADHEGKPRELALAERAARGPSSATAAADAEGGAAPTTPLPSWLADPRLTAWLRLEPAFGDVDLRPYFFFSRDRLASLGAGVRRLSQPAQELVAALLHESDAVRDNALKRAPEFNDLDAAAIFDTLVAKARQDEGPDLKNSSLRASLAWSGARLELMSELLTFLRTLPSSRLRMWLIPMVLSMTKNTPQEAAGRDVVADWGQHATDDKIKKLAVERLKS